MRKEHLRASRGNVRAPFDSGDSFWRNHIPYSGRARPGGRWKSGRSAQQLTLWQGRVPGLHGLRRSKIPLSILLEFLLVVERERRGLRKPPRLRTMAGEHDRASGSDTLFGFLRGCNRQSAYAAADSLKLAQAVRAVKLGASRCDAVVRIATAIG